MKPVSSHLPCRIVLVVPAFPKLSEKFIVTKFLGLLNRGWDVRVVCGQSHPDEWQRFPELNTVPGLRQRVRVNWPQQPRWLAAALVLPALVLGLLRAPKTSLTYLKTGFSRFGWLVLKHFYLDLQLILLHPACVHFEFGSLAVGRMVLTDLLQVPITVSFRGYDLNLVGLDQPDYYRAVWQHAAACHFLGQDLWSKAQARGCPPALPHSLIPPALELAAFPPRHSIPPESVSASRRPVQILSVGRLVWKKGYEYAFQAVRLLKDAGVMFHWHIIGDGDHRDALWFARHQLGLESCVTFHGELPHSDVIHQLQASDIFLHPAVSEGFCNAVLEAQAVGIPVVCTDEGSLMENVRDGETALIVPRRDPTALFEALRSLVQDSDLRDRMGSAGRARVASHFQLNDHLDAWHAFYQKVIFQNAETF